MSPTNQTHKLTTVADILRVVTMDNVDALAADIRGLLVNVAATKALTAAVTPDSTWDMFEGVSMDWKDDGLNVQRLIADSGQGKSLEFVTTSLKNKGKHKRPKS